MNTSRKAAASRTREDRLKEAGAELKVLVAQGHAKKKNMPQAARLFAEVHAQSPSLVEGKRDAIVAGMPEAKAGMATVPARSRQRRGESRGIEAARAGTP